MTDTSGGPPARGITIEMVLGVLLGVVLAWSSFALALTVATPGFDGPATVVVLPLALPALLGVVLLSRPRTRQAGTGFTIGLAIGLITGAGVCGATVAGLA